MTTTCRVVGRPASLALVLAFGALLGLYPMNSRGDSISPCEINQITDTPTARQQFNTGDRPLHGVIYPNGRWLYLTLEQDNEIARYWFAGSDGELEYGQSCTQQSMPIFNASHLAIHPNGDWLYVTAADGTISKYSISSAGTLNCDDRSAAGVRQLDRDKPARAACPGDRRRRNRALHHRRHHR